MAPSSLSVSLANDTPMVVKGEVNLPCKWVGMSNAWTWKFYVCECGTDVLLGLDLLESQASHIDLVDHCLKFPNHDRFKVPLARVQAVERFPEINNSASAATLSVFKNFIVQACHEALVPCLFEKQIESEFVILIEPIDSFSSRYP